MNTGLRIALALGAAIDIFVAIVSMFFPAAMGPLFDIPARDPAIAFLGGGELLVAGCIYLILLRDLARFRPLLWLVALDQAFAVLLPGIEIARGFIPATVKTIGPMPLNAALAIVYVIAARRDRSTQAAPG